MFQRNTNNKPEGIVNAYSPRLAVYFCKYLKRRFFPSVFHAVRFLGRENMPDAHSRPVIIFMNHGSWWDPITILMLATHMFPMCRLFGPMDSEMLKKYAFLAKIGAFPIEQKSTRGAVSFLRSAKEILMTPGCILAFTPQGEFTDIRVRPVIFKPGIAHLAREFPNALFVPVAVEQTFWNEKKPELLISIAAPIDASAQGEKSIEEWNEFLQGALTKNMDALAAVSMKRDTKPFETLLLAEAGTSPIYDFWRWVKAKISGKNFTSSHGDQNK